ncbi:ATP-binding cassette domain-containing protein [Nocardioides sp. S-58]|uniref:ATP-binding cassette domain-containing protein n=1 Tax=Nocardioides renjunii TaxID=3095075 RepID=A0ABU5K5J6_9ACTN|nr:ATP-binding cassette domain-containing protein [Nocardioides sp. S-58]MDZ5660213.1 ATP-binding cassette domain-containing protein [Nocardioides sp. S-58]
MITVRGLTKDFRAVRAVDDLDFTVEPGSVTGFLGPNGAGKSTTMRMVLGLDRPTSGTALVLGRPYADLRAPLCQVGALLDANAMHPGRSGRGHLRTLALSNGISAARVEAVIEQVGLGQAAGRRVKAYSLGMRQRLGIAAALLGDPAVLLFDEPVNGLDLDGVRWIRALLRGFADEGRTVLVSSHLMSEMQVVADRLVIVGRGRLVADATTQEVLLGLGGQRVRVGTTAAAVLAAALRGRAATVEQVGPDELDVTGLAAREVGDVALAVGAPVHHLAPVEHSLEQAFLRLTGDDVEYHGTVPADPDHTTRTPEGANR